MRATDLMIGDWVHTPKGDFRITAIQDNDVVFTDYADDIDGAVDIEYIEPICITNEILLKVGFCTTKTNGMHGYYTGEYNGKLFRCEYMKPTAQSGKVLGIQYLGECGYVSNTFNFPLPKFLHELQHAFKICGIRKEIEL